MSGRPQTEGSFVLPVYLVVDTSFSLSPEMTYINEAVAALFRVVAADPPLDAVVRISLIAFSDSARTVIPLSQVGNNTDVPPLTAGGGTNYSSALRLVRQVIPADIAGAKREGCRVFRPVMFFVTDGSPVEPSWQLALDELRSPEFRERPTIVAIGFGSADPAIIREIGSDNGGAFMISDAISVQEAIGSAWSSLTQMLRATVISSSAGRSTSSVEVPPQWIDLSRTS